MSLTIEYIKKTPSTAQLLVAMPANRSRLGMRSSDRQGDHQPIEPDDIQDPPETESECSQAELGANFLQATHQKRTLIHPLLDRPKRMFDRLTSLIEDTGALLRRAGIPLRRVFTRSG
jgi:hypothetical protein